jgi:hypothetical protein
VPASSLRAPAFTPRIIEAIRTKRPRKKRRLPPQLPRKNQPLPRKPTATLRRQRRQGRLRKNQEKNPASDLEETRSQAASACADCAVMRQPAARPLRPASPPVNQPKDRQSNAGLQADCPPETSSDWSCRTRGCVRTRESRVAFVVP